MCGLCDFPVEPILLRDHGSDEEIASHQENSWPNTCDAHSLRAKLSQLQRVWASENRPPLKSPAYLPNEVHRSEPREGYAASQIGPPFRPPLRRRGTFALGKSPVNGLKAGDGVPVTPRFNPLVLLSPLGFGFGRVSLQKFQDTH